MTPHQNSRNERERRARSEHRYAQADRPVIASPTHAHTSNHYPAAYGHARGDAPNTTHIRSHAHTHTNQKETTKNNTTPHHTTLHLIPSHHAPPHHAPLHAATPRSTAQHHTTETQHENYHATYGKPPGYPPLSASSATESFDAHKTFSRGRPLTIETRGVHYVNGGTTPEPPGVGAGGASGRNGGNVEVPALRGNREVVLLSGPGGTGG